jgi:hypothetical protein
VAVISGGEPSAHGWFAIDDALALSSRQTSPTHP